MRVISRRVLKEYGDHHAEARGSLNAWYEETKKANWKTSQDIKNEYASASFLEDNRVIFNIKGNSYRLIVHLKYAMGVVMIKWIGTHAEYDKIDAAKVSIS